ncbi:hypothetical protein JCM30566_17320 [Marinitoga arctica]
MSKIKNITFTMKKYDYFKPFHITGSISNFTTNIEVCIETENGAKGYGESSPSFRVNGEKIETLIHLEPIIKDAIIGLDVKNYRKIFDIMDKFFAFPSIKCCTVCNS